MELGIRQVLIKLLEFALILTLGVGGNSTQLVNVAGPQAYLHTPSGSIVAVGNNNRYYWNEGTGISVSDDALNWKYFADPITTPDPQINPYVV